MASYNQELERQKNPCGFSQTIVLLIPTHIEKVSFCSDPGSFESSMIMNEIYEAIFMFKKRRNSIRWSLRMNNILEFDCRSNLTLFELMWRHKARRNSAEIDVGCRGEKRGWYWMDMKKKSNKSEFWSGPAIKCGRGNPLWLILFPFFEFPLHISMVGNQLFTNGQS